MTTFATTDNAALVSEFAVVALALTLPWWLALVLSKTTDAVFFQYLGEEQQTLGSDAAFW